MEQLLEQAKRGDKSAEEELFRFLVVRFRYIAKQYVSEGDAEDIANDACLTVLQKYRTEEITESFKAWSYGILRYKMGNFFQKQRVRRRLNSDNEQICYMNIKADQNKDVAPDFMHKLKSCLQKLLEKSPRYARVLNLSHLGYDTTYICEKLDVKRSNLYMMLNRSRKQLDDCLNKGYS